MLWSSRVWSWREKLAGTLLLHGGLFGVVLSGLAGASSHSSGGCTSSVIGPGRPPTTHCVGDAASSGPNPLQIIVIALLALTPIAMSVCLATRIRRPRAA